MNDIKPQVSILTTVYNREKYLIDCITSVQNGHFQDYEHIIVDDRSTDSSLAIAQEMATLDERIQVHLNEENLGDYPNRNKAASFATGTYLKYLDADDFHGRWTLDIMVDAMELYPEAGLGLVDHKIQYQPLLISGKEAFEQYYSGKSNLFHRSPLSAMIRRASFESIGGFQSEPFTGDYNLWHRLASQSPVVIFPNSLLFWRDHDDQQSTINNANPIHQLSHLLARIDNLKNSKFPIEPNLREHNLEKAYRQLARTILVHIRRGNWPAAQEVRKHLGWTWRKVFITSR